MLSRVHTRALVQLHTLALTVRKVTASTFLPHCVNNTSINVHQWLLLLIINSDERIVEVKVVVFLFPPLLLISST